MNVTVSDPYINYETTIGRLRREYEKYGKLIIAFDFDDTVFDTHYNGWAYDKVIALLQRWRPHAYLICWSASGEERYPRMRAHFHANNIPFDAINENAPWMDNGCRKIYANAYLDDRCGMATIYNILLELIEEIEKGDLVCSCPTK